MANTCETMGWVWDSLICSWEVLMNFLGGFSDAWLTLGFLAVGRGLLISILSGRFVFIVL